MFLNRLEEQINLKCNGQQKVLSNMTGIPAATINCWFKRETKPTYIQIIKLADCFEITTDYLLGRENDYGIVNANANLTPLENNLLQMFKTLSRDKQNRAIGYIRALAE